MTLNLLQIGNEYDQYVIDTRFLTKEDIESLLKLISSKLIVGHNFKFDYKVLHKYGFKPDKIFDTMLASQVAHCGIKDIKHSLQNLTRLYVDEYAYTNQTNLFRPVITKDIRMSFTGLEPYSEAQVIYGALDVEYTSRLYHVMTSLLEKHELTKCAELEFDFSLVAGDMEMVGMPFDVKTWIENAMLRVDTYEKLSDRLKRLYDINWNSPKQVLPILKEHGVDPTLLDRKTGEIKESVASLVVKKQRNVHEIVGLYLDYKKAQKSVTSYGEKFLRHVNPHTGRIHADIFQIKDTGRTGCGSPNLQNIPADPSFRRAFKAPVGKTLLVADYKNQELQVLADKSKEPKMIQAFKEGRDIHLATAQFMYNNPDLTKESPERQFAKSTNFLASYGGGAHKLADAFGITLSKAKEVLSIYFKTYSNLEPYFKKAGQEAKDLGYIKIDNVVGRKTFIDNYDWYVEARRRIAWAKATDSLDSLPRRYVEAFNIMDASIQRKAQNYPIQGTSANISKLAGIYLRKQAIKTGLFNVLMLIHDEYVIECDEVNADQVKKILSDCMEKASSYFLEDLIIKADASVSSVWQK